MRDSPVVLVTGTRCAAKSESHLSPSWSRVLSARSFFVPQICYLPPLAPAQSQPSCQAVSRGKDCRVEQQKHQRLLPPAHPAAGCRTRRGRFSLSWHRLAQIDQIWREVMPYFANWNQNLGIFWFVLIFYSVRWSSPEPSILVCWRFYTIVSPIQHTFTVAPSENRATQRKWNKCFWHFSKAISFSVILSFP